MIQGVTETNPVIRIVYANERGSKAVWLVAVESECEDGVYGEARMVRRESGRRVHFLMTGSFPATFSWDAFTFYDCDPFCKKKASHK